MGAAGGGTLTKKDCRYRRRWSRRRESPLWPLPAPSASGSLRRPSRAPRRPSSRADARGRESCGRRRSRPGWCAGRPAWCAGCRADPGGSGPGSPLRPRASRDRRSPRCSPPWARPGWWCRCRASRRLRRSAARCDPPRRRPWRWRRARVSARSPESGGSLRRTSRAVRRAFANASVTAWDQSVLPVSRVTLAPLRWQLATSPVSAPRRSILSPQTPTRTPWKRDGARAAVGSRSTSRRSHDPRTRGHRPGACRTRCATAGRRFERLRGALSLTRYFNAHLDVLHAQVRPSDLLGGAARGLSESVRARMVAVLDADAVHEQAALQEHFIALCADHDIAVSNHPENGVPTAFWQEISGARSELVALRGRVSDLVIIPHSKTGDATATFDEAILHTGRPVLLVPRGMWEFKLHRVLIGWTGSLEGGRAVQQALPFLKRAEAVTVATTKDMASEIPSAEDLQHYLSFHEIAAEIRNSRSRGAWSGRSLVGDGRRAGLRFPGHRWLHPYTVAAAPAGRGYPTSSQACGGPGADGPLGPSALARPDNRQCDDFWVRYDGARAFAGSLISGLGGFGGSFIIVIVMTPVVGAKAVIPLIAVYAICANLSRVFIYRQTVAWAAAAQFTLASLPGIYLGARILKEIPETVFLGIMGAVLILILPARRYLRKRSFEPGLKTIAILGFLFGFMSGTAAGSGMLVIAFSTASDWAGHYCSALMQWSGLSMPWRAQARFTAWTAGPRSDPPGSLHGASHLPGDLGRQSGWSGAWGPRFMIGWLRVDRVFGTHFHLQSVHATRLVITNGAVSPNAARAFLGFSTGVSAGFGEVAQDDQHAQREKRGHRIPGQRVGKMGIAKGNHGQAAARPLLRCPGMIGIDEKGEDRVRKHRSRA